MFRSSYTLDRTWKAHKNLQRRGPGLGDEAVAAAGATTPLSAAEPQLSMILCGSSGGRGEVAAHCWPRQGWIGRVKSRATHTAHRTTLGRVKSRATHGHTAHCTTLGLESHTATLCIVHWDDNCTLCKCASYNTGSSTPNATHKQERKHLIQVL